VRTDIEIKNVHRNTNCGASVWYVHDTRYMALNRRTREEEIDLVVVIPWHIVSIPSISTATRGEHTKPPQILDDPQASLSIRHCRIQIMLFACLVYAEPFKVDIPAWPKLGLYRAGDVDGRLHPELRHAVLHDGKLECDDAGHLNGAAETNLAITLREVQVANAEFRTRDMHGQKDFGPARQVFDIAVS
jgi:hypothetical protein